MTQEYGLPIGDGYVFIRRVDGAQFLSGTYGLVLTATNADAQQGEFTGEFILGTAVPTTPTPLPIATPIFDTIGRAATVTSG